MVSVKTFVIFVPFVFQLTVPETTIDKPKTMSEFENEAPSVLLCGALCASVVTRSYSSSWIRVSPKKLGES